MARKYSKAASKDVEKALHKQKEGKLKSGKGGKGGKVKSRKQAPRPRGLRKRGLADGQEKQKEMVRQGHA